MDVPFLVEAVGPTEQRVSFRVGDSWCRSHSIGLRSGMRLGVSALAFEPAFGFSIEQSPAELELTVSKGAVLPTRTRDGHTVPRGGNTLQLGRTHGAQPTRVQAPHEVRMECVSVTMSQACLRDLLGVTELPRAYREVTESRDPYPLVSQAMTPKLFGLLDEIVNADVCGPARQLWHEAKSLELIALISDEVAETARAQQPRLSAHDIERLQRVRRCLSEHLAAPPTLAELARSAGCSETKLKAGFRTLFGTSLFAYLRQARMEQARCWLLERHLNVTEIAQRVGYGNPSKFAAAFKKQFGVSPSAV
jgi:AraC-like DNA-binding protein